MTDTKDDTKDLTAFDKIRAESDTIQARFDAGAEKVIAHAASIGATVTKEEVATMPSLKIYALGDDHALNEAESYERELYAIPQIREAKRREAMAQEIKAGEGAAHDELNRMRPAQRMEFARKYLGTAPGDDGETPAAEISKEDKLKILLQMPPAARIAQARAWEMTGE